MRRIFMRPENSGLLTKAAVAIAAGLMAAACSSGGDADRDGDGNITAQEARAEMASGGAVNMTPGEYEMKISFTEMDAPGIPAVARDAMSKQMLQGMTFKNCVTQKELDDPGAAMFGGQDDDSCKLERFDRSGGNMRVAMTCTQPGGLKMSSSMNGSFGADSYAMDVEQKMTGMPMGDIHLKGKIEAKRIGDCPA